MDAPLLEEMRKRSFQIAYRMIGSVADAEDIVQEALLRTHRAAAAGQAIESPIAFAARTTTRLAIDHLRSARVKRERYVGEWLPEPLVTAPDETSREAEVASSLSIAFLILLESLSPNQRAALLLRDAFSYEFDEIAAVIGTSEANARQLVTRARHQVGERRPRFEVSPERRNQLAERFYAAAREGDLAGLEALLAHDVVLRGDGGGKVPALARPVHGRAPVARAMARFTSRIAASVGTLFQPVEVNGEPGAITLDAEGRVLGVMSLDIADDQIQSVTFVVNPDKLRHIGPVGDLRALLEPGGA